MTLEELYHCERAEYNARPVHTDVFPSYNLWLRNKAFQLWDALQERDRIIVNLRRNQTGVKGSYTGEFVQETYNGGVVCF